eukprot:sb/3462466/
MKSPLCYCCSYCIHVCNKRGDFVSDTPIPEDEISKNQELRKEKIEHKKYVHQHGVCPPFKNVRKKRFRKTAPKKIIDDPEVEKEVRRLLRADISAISVTTKIIYDNQKPSAAPADAPEGGDEIMGDSEPANTTQQSDPNKSSCDISKILETPQEFLDKPAAEDVDADDPDGGISKELFDMFQDLSSDDGDSSADEEESTLTAQSLENRPVSTIKSSDLLINTGSQEAHFELETLDRKIKGLEVEVERTSNSFLKQRLQDDLGHIVTASRDRTAIVWEHVDNSPGTPAANRNGVETKIRTLKCVESSHYRGADISAISVTTKIIYDNQKPSAAPADAPEGGDEIMGDSEPANTTQQSDPNKSSCDISKILETPQEFLDKPAAEDVDADDPDGGISKELFDMFQDLSSDDGDSSADEEESTLTAQSLENRPVSTIKSSDLLINTGSQEAHFELETLDRKIKGLEVEVERTSNSFLKQRLQDDLRIYYTIAASKIPSSFQYRWRKACQLKGHTGFVNAVAALKATPEFPEGLIVTGSQDKTINIYFPSDPEPIQRMEGHEGDVTCISTGWNGTILSGSADTTVRVWEGFREKEVLKGHSAPVWDVAIFPGGEMGGVMGEQCGVWEGFREKEVLKGHSAPVWDVAIFPGQGTFLSASGDKSIILWNNGKKERVFKGHSSAVRKLVVLPEPQSFVSVGNDGQVCEWSSEKEQAMAKKTVSSNFLYSVCLLSTSK